MVNSLKGRSHKSSSRKTKKQRVLALEQDIKNEKWQQKKESFVSRQSSADSDPPKATINRLINLYNNRNLALVSAQAKQLTTQYPKAIIVWNLLGAANKGLGKFTEASKAFKKVTTLNPNYPEGYNNLGVALKDQGRLDESIEAYKEAISIKPNYADAHYNLGNALKDQGNLTAAITAYSKVISIQPDFSQAFSNMGIALKNQGKFNEAVKAFNRALVLQPNSANSLYNRALTLLEQKKISEAIKAFGEAILVRHDYPEAHNNLGIAFQKQGKLDKAIKSYKKALDFKPDYADAAYNAGHALQAQHRLDEAIYFYKKSLSLKPNYTKAHNNMGLAFYDQGLLDNAIIAYQQALNIQPNYAEAYNNLGNALQGQGKLEKALEAYKSAITFAPNYEEAWANGADTLEKWNKLFELELWLKQALETFDIVPPNVQYYQAKLLSRNKKLEKALRLIETIELGTINDTRKKSFLNLKAKCYEAINEFDKAYICFQKMNKIAKTTNDYLRSNHQNYFQNAKKQLQQLKSKPVSRQFGEAKDEKGFCPVFLMGFPRSGTTLIDTILRSHSHIQVVEEQPCVTAARNFIEIHGYFDTVNQTLPSDIKEGARDAYVLKLSQHFDNRNLDITCIDKLPLNLLEVPLIHQIYPQAKYILALRHPMDAILSCWMQDFKLNPAMSNMVDLGQIVELYCISMETFKICRNEYNFSTHQFRYEDLLNSLRGETSSILKFLNLDWESGIENYTETALKRGKIKTPSYSQVVQPIYKDSKFRWLKYEKYLSKYLNQIEPWINEFEYGHI